MDVSVSLWAAVCGLLALALALDLFVFHRNAHEVSMREAALTSAVWVALGLSFGLVVWALFGSASAGEYLAGYLIEKSLSVDNIFVLAIVLSYFAVPAAYQHRLLFWGVVGALIMRGIFIGLGSVLLENFHWVIYVFGGFLVFTGLKMAFHRQHPVDPQKNRAVALVRRVLPMTPDYEGQRFFVRNRGRLFATPLLAALIVVETTDLIFAIDSIPAIFAVTKESFLVFTSNAFAILGLRALYFLLAGMMQRFVFLKAGLAAILVFVGFKMLVSDVYKIPVWWSLAVIASLLGVAVGLSWWKTSRTADPVQGVHSELPDEPLPAEESAS